MKRNPAIGPVGSHLRVYRDRKVHHRPGEDERRLNRRRTSKVSIPVAECLRSLGQVHCIPPLDRRETGRHRIPPRIVGDPTSEGTICVSV